MATSANAVLAGFAVVDRAEDEYTIDRPPCLYLKMWPLPCSVARCGISWAALGSDGGLVTYPRRECRIPTKVLVLLVLKGLLAVRERPIEYGSVQY
jgi:hypothetical protein